MKQSSLRKKILLNIEEDRQKSKEFVDNISNFLSNTNGITGEEYSKIMMSAAKLMEVNSKSTEHIVKLFETVKKYKPKKDVQSNELSPEEVQKILGEVVES